MTVDGPALDKAYDAWYTHFPDKPPHASPFSMFLNYLGPDAVKLIAKDEEQPPEVMRRVEMLLGPNCLTVMRAWFALNNYPWKT